ncbi:hypothetical protein [Bradyrhizobium sp. USDA 4486]
MTIKTSRKTSRDLPGWKSRHEKKRDTQEAIIGDAGESEDNGRDLLHGDGGTVAVPTKPGDMSQDD